MIKNISPISCFLILITLLHINNPARGEKEGLEIPDPGKQSSTGDIRLRLLAEADHDPMHCERVAFSPDGKLIATSGSDALRLWDRTGKLVRSKTRITHAIYCISFTPDGKYILSGSDDHKIRIWNLDLKIIQVVKGHNGAVSDISVSPDGNLFASASDDKTAKIWNRDGSLLADLKGHKQKVRCVAFHPDGKTLATGSEDKTIKVWNSRGMFLWDLTKRLDAVNCLRYSPDGEYLLSGDISGQILFWHKQWDLSAFISGSRPIKSIIFWQDGNKFAFCTSLASDIYIFDMEGKQLNHTKPGSYFTHHLAISPDGNILVSVSTGPGKVRFWTMEK